MKQLTDYITEKQSFLVKKHVGKNNYEISKEGVKKWLSNAFGVEYDKWDGRLSGWYDSHTIENYVMSKNDLTALEKEYNEIFTGNDTFLNAELTYGKSNGNAILEFTFDDKKWGGTRTFMKIDYSNDYHRVILKETELEP